MESVSAVPRDTRVRRSADADRWVAALFEAEAARLVSLARFFTDDRTAAEDLVQEAFIRLARSAHRIVDHDRAAAYLRSIVINLARDHNRRGLVSFRHRPPAAPDETLGRGRGGAATSRGARWWRRCAALPGRQRECLALRYYLELSVDEIAATLGISVELGEDPPQTRPARPWPSSWSHEP